MTARNLLLTVFFDESKLDGWCSFSNLITRSCDSTTSVTVYAAGKKRVCSWSSLDPTDRFNIAEVALMCDSRKLRLRYRPSVSSRWWYPLASQANVDIVKMQDHELFQLFLTLAKFSRPGLPEEARTRGVVELLWHDSIQNNDLEETMSTVAKDLCEGLLRPGTWGYADPVPSRGLSLDEEWEVALTSLLWIELPSAAEGNHQFVFSCEVENNDNDTAIENTAVKVEVRRVPT